MTSIISLGLTRVVATSTKTGLETSIADTNVCVNVSLIASLSSDGICNWFRVHWLDPRKLVSTITSTRATAIETCCDIPLASHDEIIAVIARTSKAMCEIQNRKWKSKWTWRVSSWSFKLVVLVFHTDSTGTSCSYLLDTSTRYQSNYSRIKLEVAYCTYRFFVYFFFSR